ncbi:hypothetical protein HDU67_009235 [Dinochytrium kinnereticum]|nr:hypothetical protein HDU67_009235 [Dinochytrium kinnereticum]
METDTHSFAEEELLAMLNLQFAHGQRPLIHPPVSQQAAARLQRKQPVFIPPASLTAAASFPSPERTPLLTCFDISPMISGAGQGDFELDMGHLDPDLALLSRAAEDASCIPSAPTPHFEVPPTPVQDVSSTPASSAVDVADLLNFNTHAQRTASAPNSSHSSHHDFLNSLFGDIISSASTVPSHANMDIFHPQPPAADERQIAIPLSVFQTLTLAASHASRFPSSSSSSSSSTAPTTSPLFDQAIEMDLSTFQLLSTIANLPKPTTETLGTAPTPLPIAQPVEATSRPKRLSTTTVDSPVVAAASGSFTTPSSTRGRRRRSSTTTSSMSPTSPQTETQVADEKEWIRVLGESITEVVEGRERVFRCPFEGCGLTGKRRYNVQMHLRTHMPDELRRRDFRCKDCQRGYLRFYELERHWERKGHAGQM